MKSLGLIFLICVNSLLACTQPSSPCAYNGNGADYLLRIGCAKDFNYLQGRPLTEKFGHASSVKIVYSIADKLIYFINSSRFPFHYEFCTNVLGVKDDVFTFNSINYKENRNRQYILCNLNYYSHLDIYALELMAEDDTKAEELFSLYQKIKELTSFGQRIKMLVSTPEAEMKFAAIPALPIIQADEIYKGRQFVSLNKGIAFGYLRKIEKNEINNSIGKHDIVILNGLPNELPVVAGVLTTPLQTPLCHISLLCQNRGTPNAVYRKAWQNNSLNLLVNKLVRYEVTADTFLVRSATEAEAQAYWKKQEKRKSIQLKVDSTEKRLFTATELSYRSVSMVGGKAANFGELTKIKVDKQSLRIPECSFAIPFYYYYDHLQKNNIRPLINLLLNDPKTLSDPVALSLRLKAIRNAIKDAPLEKEFLEAVTLKMKSFGSEFVNYRFRSSTNAEDVKGFNGAGLYDSKTGSLTDPGKTVEKAIKGVWASLWEDRAFKEREFFRIDQHFVAMGILVHRAFGEELSNGVAVTRHLYRKNYPAYTINVQLGEVSVVSPPDSVTCDEAIIGLGEVTGSRDIAIEYIGRSSLSKDKPILTREQIELLTQYLTAIKKHFYKFEGSGDYSDFTMDVEFKIDAYSGELYVKQARVL